MQFSIKKLEGPQIRNAKKDIYKINSTITTVIQWCRGVVRRRVGSNLGSCLVNVFHTVALSKKKVTIITITGSAQKLAMALLRDWVR